MNKFFSKKKIKSLIKTAKNKAINYIKYNRLFLSFVGLSFLNCFLIRTLTVGNWYNDKTIFIDLFVNVLLGSFCYFIDVKHQFKYLVSLMFFNGFICVVNAIYYEFFGTFASLGLLMTLGQVTEVGNAVFEKLSVLHFLYVIPFIIFIFINRFLVKRDYFNLVKKIEKGKQLFVGCLLVSAIFLTFNLVTLNKSKQNSIVL
jgi:hypothetical protein